MSEPVGKEAIAARLGLSFATLNYLVHIDDRLRIAYFETPKVACTTIKKFMQDSYLGRVRKLSRPGEVHDRARSPLKRLSDLDDAEVRRVLFGDYFRFSFVRNPFTRCLSAFLDKLVGNPAEASRHRPELGLPPERDPSFHDYLDALGRIDDSRRDIHHRLQCALLAWDTVSFDFIGHFETFGPDFDDLRREIFRAPPAETEVLGLHHAQNAAQKIRAHYDDAAEARVLEIFGADFARLGYCKRLEMAACLSRRTMAPGTRGGAVRLRSAGTVPSRVASDDDFDAAQAALRSGRHAEARERFMRIAESRAEDSLRHRAFDGAWLCQMKGPDAERTFDTMVTSPLAWEFRHTLTPVFQAAHALYRGDWEHYWHLARRLPLHDPAWFGPWNRGLSTRPERQTCTFLQSRAVERAAEVSLAEPDGGGAPVLLWAAGDRDMVRHAARVVESYRATGGTEDIRLIVLDPTPATDRVLSAIEAGDAGVRVIRRRGGADGPAFRAAARLRLARDVMAECRRPVFAFDTTVSFRSSVADLFDKTGGADRAKIGLRISPRCTLPWQLVTANAVYIPWTEAGIAFAGHLEAFLRLHATTPTGRDLWWVHQNAALSAFVASDRSQVQSLDVSGFLGPPVADAAPAMPAMPRARAGMAGSPAP